VLAEPRANWRPILIESWPIAKLIVKRRPFSARTTLKR
jgi:hypothetical protein